MDKIDLNSLIIPKKYLEFVYMLSFPVAVVCDVEHCLNVYHG